MCEIEASNFAASNTETPRVLKYILYCRIGVVKKFMERTKPTLSRWLKNLQTMVMLHQQNNCFLCVKKILTYQIDNLSQSPSLKTYMYLLPIKSIYFVRIGANVRFSFHHHLYIIVVRTIRYHSVFFLEKFDMF